MTVTYQADVATSGVLPFARVMRRWRGSVYKLLLAEFLFFSALLIIFTVLNYRVFEPELVANSHVFYEICIYCNQSLDSIPLTFILGFYVSLIVNRCVAVVGSKVDVIVIVVVIII